MRYMLDTNVCVHLLRGRKDVAAEIDRHGLQNCCISEITKAELLYGQRVAQRRGARSDGEALERLLNALEIVPIGLSLEFYAVEKDRLCACGMPIEDFDLLIGCSAVCDGSILVSENCSHMSRIVGIRLENWC